MSGRMFYRSHETLRSPAMERFVCDFEFQFVVSECSSAKKIRSSLLYTMSVELAIEEKRSSEIDMEVASKGSKLKRQGFRVPILVFTVWQDRIHHVVFDTLSTMSVLP
jgi:hypothetical protein